MLLITGQEIEDTHIQIVFVVVVSLKGESPSISFTINNKLFIYHGVGGIIKSMDNKGRQLNLLRLIIVF